jgi:hypothetical protein
MTISVQVHIRPIDGQKHVGELNRISDFLKAGVEQAMASISADVMAFDPRTGEPLYNVSYPDASAAGLVNHMTVVSPSAYIGVLLTDYVDTDVIPMEPIIMAPYFGDEDD